MSPVQHFILVFDRNAGHLVEQIPFGTHRAAAVARYGEIEKEYRNSPHMDILLVGSDSIETIKVTHANYFEDSVPDQYADVLDIVSA